MYCSKCGGELPENTKFCAGCGAPANSPAIQTQPQQYNNPPVTETVEYRKAAAEGANKLAQRFSISTKLLGVCAGMAFIFVYYLIVILDAWHFSFLNFLGLVVVPGLFVAILITQSRNANRNVMLIVPFALRALTSVIGLLGTLSYISFQGALQHIVHISIAALFVVTVFGIFDGKKIMMIVSGAATILFGVLSFRFSFIAVLVTIIYFASIFVLVTEVNAADSNRK